MATDNPWKTLTIKEVYDNNWINVTHRDVITPTGTNGIYGKVSMKNKAIGIIPIDDNEYTWLVGQYRYVVDEYSWEIPMGGSPVADAILDGAKRELREETGLRASKWVQVMKIHTSNSITDEEGFVFLAEGLTPGETEFDETEDLAIKHLPFREAVGMAFRGEITDAISLAGLMKVAAMKGVAINDS